MSTLKPWQKIRDAKRGDVVVLTKGKRVKAWIGTPGETYVTEKKVILLKKGRYDVRYYAKRNDEIWISNEKRVFVVPADVVRECGGLFKHELTAQVALQSGKKLHA